MGRRHKHSIINLPIEPKIALKDRNAAPIIVEIPIEHRNAIFNLLNSMSVNYVLFGNKEVIGIKCFLNVDERKVFIDYCKIIS